MFRKSMFCLLFFLLLPLSAPAAPTINCHCFTDRTYDPARPGASDPYFLATTQNTFFATAFATSKKNLVRKKQQGAASEDLWVAFWVAQKSATDPEALLKAKADSSTWKAALASLKINPESLGPRFAAALNGEGSAPLDQVVVDELFLRFRILGEADLATLRKAGVSNQELILATLIGLKSKRPPEQIVREAKAGGKSWGELLTAGGIDITNIQQDFSAMLR